MPKELYVEGYDNFIKAIEEQKGDVFVLFSGTAPSGGVSWCPDCVAAEPVIKECLPSAPEDAVFIHCGVGGRDFWKDKTNPFRTNEKLKLAGVPTLLRWGQSQKLVEEQCSKKDLVQMLFEES